MEVMDHLGGRTLLEKYVTRGSDLEILYPGSISCFLSSFLYVDEMLSARPLVLSPRLLCLQQCLAHPDELPPSETLS